MHIHMFVLTLRNVEQYLARARITQNCTFYSINRIFIRNCIPIQTDIEALDVCSNSIRI